MNDDHSHGPTEPDDDTGRPVEELTMIEDEVPRRFLQVVHRKIERRVVTGQFFEVGLLGLGTVFLQYLVLLLDVVMPKKDPDEGSESPWTRHCRSRIS